MKRRRTQEPPHEPPVTAEGDRLEDELVPTLDGKRLTAARSRRGLRSYTTEDGEPVPEARERDIVYVNPRLQEPLPVWWGGVDLGAPGERLFEEPARTVKVGQETFAEDDVAAMLVQVASAFVPAAAPEMSPVSLHRLLIAWLSVDDEETSLGGDEREEADLPWGFWKATLEEGSDPGSTANIPVGAMTYTAHVHWGESGAPHAYAYWILRSKEGGLRAAGWLAMPPAIPTEARFSLATAPVDAAMLFGAAED